jgi:hypothetical protein
VSAAKPGILLTEWSNKENAAVLTLKVFLTAECEIVGMELLAETGRETEAAVASFKLGQLSSHKGERS